MISLWSYIGSTSFVVQRVKRFYQETWWLNQTACCL